MQDLFDKYGHPIRVLIDPDCPAELFDKSGRPHIVVENADGIDLSTGEFLAALLKGGNLLHIPTNAGWTEVLAQAGSTSQALTSLNVTSGATAGGKGLLHGSMIGLANGISYNTPVRLDRKLYLIFGCARYLSVAAAIARLQLKQVNTEGALSAKGFGLRVDNMALVGESYGTELGTVSLATSLVNVIEAQIVILFDPATPKIEWYVNGVLKGTQSTVAKIPTGSLSYPAPMVMSVINGAAASNASWWIFRPIFWQVR